MLVLWLLSLALASIIDDWIKASPSDSVTELPH